MSLWGPGMHACAHSCRPGAVARAGTSRRWPPWWLACCCAQAASSPKALVSAAGASPTGQSPSAASHATAHTVQNAVTAGVCRVSIQRRGLSSSPEHGRRSSERLHPRSLVRPWDRAVNRLSCVRSSIRSSRCRVRSGRAVYPRIALTPTCFRIVACGSASRPRSLFLSGTSSAARHEHASFA